MRFGALVFPFHNPMEDPTLQLEGDLALAELCDRLGYDEFWFGEHHSGGWQIIASPELMIAAAAQRTRRIRLGTGVATLSYHHPFLLLDRIIQLDHLTRGRLIFGVGSGALPLDASTIGHDPMQARRMMAESLEAITAMLRYDGPVTRTTDWFRLEKATLHLRPYQWPLDIRVAAFKSPAGPRLAGRFGAGIISFGASAAIGTGSENPLRTTAEIADAEAHQVGLQFDRSRWSVMSLMHVAPTEAQARAEVRWGITSYIKFVRQILPINVPVDLDDPDAVVDVLTTTGNAVIGTPEQAIRHIERMWELSGGFGTFLIEQSDIADPDATRRSYDLFARRVMPYFTASTWPRIRAYEAELQSGGMTRRTMAAAQAKAGVEYHHEVAERRRAT
ncbi:LLM class flavin-dependent oxidoreductase [Actinoplanes siamensis]|uniref:Monooxygenase (Luciferase-like) n=1 Tax=Actinoplanes siamensis TaxID=1223317 RepID=A0A919N5N5_9ACTN|nr:LLM class flavin-dependent oxidoreductase [Actinoplanes siamensis]GIF04903.1 putative monooxygenase (luciferase-like) [Actinoplanes siamensis]